MDIEYYRKYQSEKIKTGLSSAVDSFQILDNKTVLTAHDDYILRLFDLNNGMVNVLIPNNRTKMLETKAGVI